MQVVHGIISLYRHVKTLYEALFVSYAGAICSPARHRAVAGDLERQSYPHSTVDNLGAYRVEFHYRIAAQVQRNCVNKLWKLSSMHGLYWTL